MEKFDTPKIKEAIKYALGGLAIGTLIATGIALEGNSSNQKKGMNQRDYMQITKFYKDVSYLEIVKERNRTKEVSQGNLLNDSKSLGFRFPTENKTAKRYFDCFEKNNVESKNFKDYPLKYQERINSDVKNYIKYFKEKREEYP
jgi:hypothetical protein